MADGIIEARFFNPYFVPEGEWSSGFLFRRTGPMVGTLIGINGWGELVSLACG